MCVICICFIIIHNKFPRVLYYKHYLMQPFERAMPRLGYLPLAPRRRLHYDDGVKTVYEKLQAEIEGDSSPVTELTPEQCLEVFAETGNFPASIRTSIDTDRARRERLVAQLVYKGRTSAEIRQHLMDRFGVCEATASADITRLRKQARLTTSDEGAMDIIVQELTNHALQRARMFHAEAVAPVPEDMVLTPQNVSSIQRSRVEASKEARASAEFVLDVFGRTSSRWSQKQQLEVTPLSGGTLEQQQAVNKLLGIETREIIDVTPEEQP